MTPNHASQEHFSDEQLLAFIDGELEPTLENLVGGHLKTCWECRTALQDIEEQVHLAIEVLMDQSFVSPNRIAEAKTRFMALTVEISRSTRRTQLYESLQRFPRAAMLCTVSALIILLVALGYLFHREAVPTPHQALARSQQSQRILNENSVHQVFRVEMAQLRPSKQKQIDKVQLWSETSGRFALRLNAPDGNLRYAVWHPADDQTYEYDQNGESHVVNGREPTHAVKPISLDEACVGTRDLKDLESGFIRWVNRSPWQPIQLASDFAIFVDQQQHVSLQIERVHSGRQPLLRLTAQRDRGGYVATMILEVDARTYFPYSLKARLETAERAVEMVMSEEGLQTRPAAVAFSTVVFTPDVPVSGLAGSAGLTSDSQFSRREPPRKPTYDLDSEEVKIRYSLHRIRACLGEDIHLRRDPKRALLIVEGIVESDQRRAELLNGLAPFQGTPLAQITIHTLGEIALGGRGREQNGSEPSRMARAIEIRSGLFPIKDLLERHFTNPHGGALGSNNQFDARDTGQKVMELRNNAVALSNTALMQAWALRRLGENGPPLAGSLTPEAEWLLEVMLREHLDELKSDLGRYRQLLEPVLLSAASSVPVIEQGPLPEIGNPPLNVASRWYEKVHQLFAIIAHCDRLTVRLFAGSDLSEDPEKALGQLIQGLEQAEGEVELTKVQVVQDSDLSDKASSESVADRM